MLAAKVLNGLELLEEVPLHHKLVAKLVHNHTLKPRQTHLAMQEELIRVTPEQGDCPVSQHIIISQNLKRTQTLWNRHRIGSTDRNSPLRNAPVDSIRQRLRVNILKRSSLAWSHLPAELLWIAHPQPVVKDVTRHQHRRILHLVERPAVIRVRRGVYHRSRKPDGDDLLPGSVGHIDILGSKVNRRREFPHLPGNLLPGAVCHILTQYYELRRVDTEKQPAAIRVQKGTARLHPLHQFARRLLRLHHAVLIAVNNRFNILYRQFFHVHYSSFGS